MAKRDRVVEVLDRLRALRDATPPAEGLAAVLRPHLDDKVNLVVERAARIAGERRLVALVPELIRAFDRMMATPTKTDPGCVAKLAIVKALCDLDANAEDVFLRGAHHVQLEGGYGGSNDTAAGLRAQCALGLVACGHRDVLYELCELLFDGEAGPRLAAARGLADTGQDAAALLLRAKVLAGDANPETISECFAGLLQLQPARSVQFVASFLSHHDEPLVEMAALALGGSRRPEAFELLRGAWDTSASRLFAGRRSLLLAIAMTRRPEAVEMLLQILSTAEPYTAADAAAAMKIYRSDDEVRSRVEAAVNKRDVAAVVREWRQP